ncbi:uncharacterized protein A4U43_C04F31110 [Asparagus officinalis]|uniref:Endoglucanase n=1 Tax=Asparagus officinalis TaxID=4686 RepID=A0A5P1F5E3_ASPOF|nr:uncharacterized protein A4U43_C04F31110 [Asparagus officinalis]
MAFAMTMISWSVIEFEREIYICNQLEKALDAIQWGTDYLIKAHTQANVLWSQVGDGYSDHRCWERAEDMTTSRTAYKVDSEHPGSDIAGETAAAMAAASIVFKKYDFAYSEILLSHSKQLFSFADTYQGRYDDFVSDSRHFYPSMGFHDELLWAAAWLFKATNEEYYINYVVDKVASTVETEFDVTQFSWENKYAGLEVLLVKVLTYHGNEAYNQTLDILRAKAEFFLCACVQKNDKENVAMSPGGLLYFKEWCNMLCVSSSAFLLTVYSEYLYTSNSTLNCFIGQVQPVELLKFAQSQANYILGKNPNSMSYLVGYQSNFPTHVHHRGASIPSVSVLSVPVGCFEGYNKWYLRNESNPNVIVGALVGGPNFNDKFDDQRSNYAQNEPTLAGNAPLIGLFARMNKISRSSGEASYDHYAHFYVPVVRFCNLLLEDPEVPTFTHSRKTIVICRNPQ